MTRWFNINDAAAYLGISRQTLYREMTSGRLVPDGRIGNSWRFSESHLDSSLRERVRVPGDDDMERCTGEELDSAIRKSSVSAPNTSGYLAGERESVQGSGYVGPTKKE